MSRKPKAENDFDQFATTFSDLDNAKEEEARIKEEKAAEEKKEERKRKKKTQKSEGLIRLTLENKIYAKESPRVYNGGYYDRKFAHRTYSSHPLTERNRSYFRSTFNLRFPYLTYYQNKQMNKFVENRSRTGLSTDDLIDMKVGPSTYELPKLVGKTKINSQHPNVPSFTIRGNTNTSKQLIDRYNQNSVNSLENPGVGKYSPEKIRFGKRMPSFVMTSEKKFFSIESNQKYKMSLPIGYINTELIADSIRGFSSTKAKRFVASSEGHPGPGSYAAEKYHSFEHKFRVPRPGFCALGLGQRSSSVKNKCPGPGDYKISDNNAIYSKGHQFPHAKRLSTSITDTPGPLSYRPTDLKKYKSHNAGYTFGNDTKEYTFKKVFALNQVYNRRNKLNK